MNNNIFATFMLGKVEEQLEIGCKAFSTTEKQNEEFEKIIETIETEKLKGDIKYYNKSKQDNFYHIHNGWFTCNTISFEVDKISGNLLIYLLGIKSISVLIMKNPQKKIHYIIILTQTFQSLRKN